MSQRRVVVNTRFLLKDKLEGIGWFTYETLKRITTNNPDIEFHFLFDRAFDDSFIFSDNIVPHVIGPQARHPVLWYYWFEQSVKRKLKKLNADAFVSTDGFMSLGAKTPTVLVIHDLAFEHNKQHIGGLAGKYYRHYTPKFAQKAERIVTVSEFSKNDIIEKYNIDTDKIDVVYNGAKNTYKPIRNGSLMSVKNKFSLGKDYFVYAGSIHPRKNIKNLLVAFNKFKQQNDTDVKLLLAGRKAWMYNDTMNTYNNLQHKDSVEFLGHLSPDDLAKVIGGSMAMTYVSFFEGFGIPIIEAMQCEVPVITSNTSSMAEIGKDASLLVDPHNVDSITDAMTSIYRDEQLRSDLIAKGIERHSQFSWDKTANKFWDSIQRVL